MCITRILQTGVNSMATTMNADLPENGLEALAQVRISSKCRGYWMLQDHFRLQNWLATILFWVHETSQILMFFYSETEQEGDPIESFSTCQWIIYVNQI